MLEKLIELDKELLLFLNSKHCGWLDPIMLAMSSYTNWIIISIVMAALIYIKAKDWKKTSVVFFYLSIGLSALLTNIIKVIIERPRPIHNEAWTDILHAIEGYENSFSFFSSHSSTTFAMATFFCLFFGRINKVYGVVAIIWATCVAYSRIYLAKHYPIDVMVGIAFGIMMGFVGYKLFEYYKKRMNGLEA